MYTQGSQRLGDHLAKGRQRTNRYTPFTQMAVGIRVDKEPRPVTTDALPKSRSLPIGGARSDLVLIWLTGNPQQVSRCSLCSLLSRAFRLRFGGPDWTVRPRDTPCLDSLPFHRATSGIPLRGSFAFQTYPDAGPRLAWKESGIQHPH